MARAKAAHVHARHARAARADLDAREERERLVQRPRTVRGDVLAGDRPHRTGGLRDRSLRRDDDLAERVGLDALRMHGRRERGGRDQAQCDARDETRQSLRSDVNRSHRAPAFASAKLSARGPMCNVLHIGGRAHSRTPDDPFAPSAYVDAPPRHVAGGCVGGQRTRDARRRKRSSSIPFLDHRP